MWCCYQPWSSWLCWPLYPICDGESPQKYSNRQRENQLEGASFMKRLDLRAMVNWYENRKHIKHGNDYSIIFSRIMLHWPGNIYYIRNLRHLFGRPLIYGAYASLSFGRCSCVIWFLLLEALLQKARLPLWGECENKKDRSRHFLDQRSIHCYIGIVSKCAYLLLSIKGKLPWNL